MNTHLERIVKILKDELPGKDDRLQIVHKFADLDAMTRQVRDMEDPADDFVQTESNDSDT